MSILKGNQEITQKLHKGQIDLKLLYANVLRE